MMKWQRNGSSHKPWNRKPCTLNFIQHDAWQYGTIHNETMQYNTMLYSTIQYGAEYGTIKYFFYSLLEIFYGHNDVQ